MIPAVFKINSVSSLQVFVLKIKKKKKKDDLCLEELYTSQVLYMVGLHIKKTFVAETSGKQIKQTAFYTREST